MAFRVTGGELFEDIVAREYYSEADARYFEISNCKFLLHILYVINVTSD